MKGRTFSDGSRYSYGMNGQEKDEEVGEGIYTAMYWEYDSRLGRRWNLDPKGRINESYYACFFNNPVNISDPNGDTGDPNKDNGTLNTKIYLVREKDEHGNYYASAEKMESIKKDFLALDGKVIGQYNGKDAIAHVTVEIVDSKPENLGKGENSFSVGTSGITGVNPDNTTGVINSLTWKSSSALHEWGHLFGLTDRYLPAYSWIEGGGQHHSIVTSPESRLTVALKNIAGDSEYDPKKNLYGNNESSQITSYQMKVFFGEFKEPLHNQDIVLLYPSSSGLFYDVVDIANYSKGIITWVYYRVRKSN
ncbi:MAG: hypothetical protein IPG89_13055 [Bacteroidetes bacterium]|nr:hypothetical protein [Bacteroidota bacterium]